MPSKIMYVEKSNSYDLKAASIGVLHKPLWAVDGIVPLSESSYFT